MLSRRLQDVHAAANLLSRTMLVFDDRERGQPGILFCCEPGYAKAANIYHQADDGQAHDGAGSDGAVDPPDAWSLHRSSAQHTVSG